MSWSKLLTPKRLGKSGEEDLSLDRTPFQRDYDRIVFSSAFRRLKDKTQVFSLPKSDYIRTRLIHSHEVSCVGRSLGRIVGEKVVEKHLSDGETKFTSADFGDIVSSACLAHDIGNPPFGHTGEEAISAAFKTWQQNERESYLSCSQTQELENYEGNALGFRILAKLEMVHRKGGMQLTCPTLAAFAKYPKTAYIDKDTLGDYTGKSIKKYSFFQSEATLFEEVAIAVGLIRRSPEAYWWSRHPLAFLVEAADDICYSIIDVEDGYRMKYISFEKARSLLEPIVGERAEFEAGQSQEEYIKQLRALAINNLTREAAKIFLDNEEGILSGNFDEDLLSKSEKYSLNEISATTRSKVFENPDVVGIQVAGYEVLEKLFSEFANAVLVETKKGKLIRHMIPREYQPNNDDEAYEKILKVADYIAGMTDSYATALFQHLSGISIQQQKI
ncbi:MAG: dGTP triphosphohydrolase [Cyanobacteria bacterium P01_A01_bin.135]